jgi:hypothetical protein
LPGDLVAVDPWHTEVDQHVRRPPALTECKRARAVVGHPRRDAERLEQQANAIGDAAIVIHDHDPPGCVGPTPRLRRPVGNSRGRHAHHELTLQTRNSL